jgi:hypothetical protein
MIEGNRGLTGRSTQHNLTVCRRYEEFVHIAPVWTSIVNKVAIKLQCNSV